jgi:hypothetical protein
LASSQLVIFTGLKRITIGIRMGLSCHQLKL